MALTNAEKCRRYRELHPHAWKEWAARTGYSRAERYRETKDRASEYNAQWARDNPGKRRDNERARSARKRKQFVERVDSLVVYDRYRGCCGICGDPLPVDDFHLDHIVPLTKSGLHALANLQPAHPTCNITKHARWPTVEELEAPGTREPASQGESTAAGLGCYSAGETLIHAT